MLSNKIKEAMDKLRIKPSTMFMGEEDSRLQQKRWQKQARSIGWWKLQLESIITVTNVPPPPRYLGSEMRKIAVHSTIPRVLNSNWVLYFLERPALLNAHYKGDETFMHAIWFKLR